MNAAPKTPAPRTGKRPRSPEFVRTAKALLLRRRVREAINLLRRGLNLDPACNEAALLLAKCLVAAKRMAEAQLTLDKLIDREETPQAYALLVRVCIAQQDHGGAVEVARRGLTAFPDEAQLQELLERSRLELADLLDDTTERDGDTERNGDDPPVVEPEELPTTPMPAGDPSAPFGNMLAEAGAPVMAPDTVQVAGTALTLPPVPEELATSPNYRQADDGALEDPLVIKSEHNTADRTPTPLPSDDLDFDRAPGAPDVISAVKRLVDGEPAEEEESPSSGLFDRLLGEGPPVPGSRPRARLRVVPPGANAQAVDDPDEVGGPTPADTPGAKIRQRQRRLTPREPDDPTLDLRRGTTPKRARRNRPQPPAYGPGTPARGEDQPVTGELVVPQTPPPPVTMPAARAPRVLVSPEIKSQRVPASSTEPIAAIEDVSLLSRWWPLWLTIALLVIASATVAGLVVRQQARVTRNLTRARTLAAKHQYRPLTRALHHIREAANVGGRRPEMVALAAAIHAELAYELGESTTRGAAALVEEGTRLEADHLPKAAQDLAVARAYLQLAEDPLPEAIGYLLKSIERHPDNMRLKLLYGQALMQNNELDLARKTIDALPAENLGVLRTRARLFWRLGHVGLATRLMQLAVNLGLDEDLADLELARFDTLGDKGTPLTLQRLERTIRRGNLPRTPLAWAHLLAAMLHDQNRHHLKTTRAVEQALSNRPVSDAEFSHHLGRLLLGIHRLDDALEQAREACRIAPRNPRYNTLHAEVELAMHRPEAVIRRLATGPTTALTVDARLVLARALVMKGELERARQTLDLVPRGTTHRRQLTLAWLRLAEGQPYRALRELSSLKSPRVEALVVRGSVSLALKDPGRAAHWMKAALKRDPLQADALWTLGVIARRRGDARHALDYLSHAVSANPHHRRARLDLGRLQLQLGHLAAAQRQFDELLLLEPANLQALKGRARASVELGSSEAPLYIRALRVRGHSVTATLLEARLQMVTGKLAAAAQGLRSVLARRPDRNRADIMLWLAETEHRQGDLSHAATLYHRVIAMRHPGPAPAALLGLGEISLTRGALASALQHGLAAAKGLQRGIFTLSLRARIGVLLARCYREGDALGAAIAELQDVLELDRANLTANLELGLIYGSLNKPDRAVQHLARVLDLDSNHEQAQQELSRACRELSPSPAVCRKK